MACTTKGHRSVSSNNFRERTKVLFLRSPYWEALNLPIVYHQGDKTA